MLHWSLYLSVMLTVLRQNLSHLAQRSLSLNTFSPFWHLLLAYLPHQPASGTSMLLQRSYKSKNKPI